MFRSDSAELEAFSDSVANVLRREAARPPSTSPSSEERSSFHGLWEIAKELGWPLIANPANDTAEFSCAAALDIMFRNLGAALVPGPYLPNMVLAAAVGGDLAADLSTSTPSASLPLQLIGDDGKFAASSYQLGDVSGTVRLTIDDSRWRVARVAAVDRRVIEVWDATREVMLADADRSPDCLCELDERQRQRLLTFYALAVASDSIGGAQQVLARTVEYLKTREQFGRPIGSFQALKHRVANMHSKLRLCEELVGHAVDQIAHDPDFGEFWALRAKVQATETYAWIAADCIQLHGGVGFTDEYACHLYLRRARLNEVLVGSNVGLRERAYQLLAKVLPSNSALMEMTA